MGRKRKTRVRGNSLVDNADADLPKLWQPAIPGKSETTKRTLPFYSPAQGIADPLPEPTDADVDRVLQTMGPDFALPEDARKALLASVVDFGANVAQVLSAIKSRPSQSETSDQLASIETAAVRLYEMFECSRSVASVYENSLSAAELQRYMTGLLASQARPAQPDFQLNKCAVLGVATLAHLAGLARQANACKNVTPNNASDTHSWLMANFYREFFTREPARTAGEPWVKFLAWGRSVAGLPLLSDDRLRRLSIGTIPVA